MTYRGAWLALAVLALATIVACASLRPGARVAKPAAARRSPVPPAPPPPVATGAIDARVSWLRLESAHFSLTTSRSAAAAEVILRALEEYFAALTSVCFPNTMPGPERIPVILLPDREQSRRFLAPGMSGAFHSNVMYQPAMVLGEGDYGFNDAVVRHELVHYVVRLAFRRGFPRWFEEGVASYYESIAYDRVRGQLLLGKVLRQAAFAPNAPPCSREPPRSLPTRRTCC